MKRRIYRWIFCNALGWKVTGSVPQSMQQCVFIVIPHTSWHDFYIGLLARGIINLEINWVGKKELFRFPLNLYFNWMGGQPLDRSGGMNKVDSIVQIFKKKATFRLAIAPEGTRKKVEELKTGFYYIALKANVPIISVAFDYGKKEVNLGLPFYPTDNIKEDLAIICTHFDEVVGRIPHCSFGIKNG